MINRGIRTFSSPDIASPSSTDDQRLKGISHADQDLTFEGVAANVKLLLKLIHEQSVAVNSDHDDRSAKRLASMISIIDDVKIRIQKYSPPAAAKPKKVFRRCHTDLRPHRAPKDKRSADMLMDDKEKLRRELQASTIARKSLEAMCCSLGKEKEIMASELCRNVQKMDGMEELIHDLQAQNQTLSSKVQACVAEHGVKRDGEDWAQDAVMDLQERSKMLSEKYLKSLDEYKSLKRIYTDSQEGNGRIQKTIEEMRVDVAGGLERIHGFKQQLETKQVWKEDINQQISELESMFESFNVKITELDKMTNNSTGN